VKLLLETLFDANSNQDFGNGNPNISNGKYIFELMFCCHRLKNVAYTSDSRISSMVSNCNIAVAIASAMTSHHNSRVIFNHAL